MMKKIVLLVLLLFAFTSCTQYVTRYEVIPVDRLIDHRGVVLNE